ncbi:MAG: HAMP domain-containing protein, partial [Anaerolineales bacterium]|nr:HAMP domain-containing protein [Anaerolineales bacterium]
MKTRFAIIKQNKDHKTQSRLRNKIIAWSLIPTAVILIAVALVALTTYRQVTEKLVKERNQALVDNLTGQLEGALTEYSNKLYAIAGQSEFYLDGGAGTPIDESIFGLFDGGMMWLDENGVVVSSYPSRPDLVGRDLAGASYFQMVEKKREPAWSDVEDWGINGEPVVLAAIPLLNPHSEFEGVAAGMVRVLSGSQTRLSEFYTGLFRKLSVIDDENIYLVDRNGRAVLHTDTYRIGEDIAGQDIVQQVLAGSAGGIRTHDLDGNPVLVSFTPVENTPWSLVTEEDWSELTRTSRRYESWLLLLLVLGVIAPAVMVSIGVQRIIQPIGRFMLLARQIAGGDLDQRVDLNTRDELEELAHQFNQMAAQLRESYTTLERRVEERTRELAALNTVISVVSRSLNLDEIMQAALDKTMELTGMEMGNALRLDPQGLPPTIIAHRGLSENFIQQVASLPLESSIAGEAAELFRPVVRTVEEYPKGPVKEAMRAEKIELAIGVPLVYRGEALGAINLGSASRRLVTIDELDLL